MTVTAAALGWRNGTSRPSFRPGAGAPTPSSSTRNGTRRARPWGPRRAPTRALRGHPLRPIRAAVLGFSVSGGGLELAEILSQHALVLWSGTTIRLYCRSHRPSQSRRGSHIPEVRMVPERARTASPDPHRRAAAGARARLKYAAGPEGAGDGRSRRGRVGHRGRHRGALAAPSRGQGAAVPPAGPRGRSAATVRCALKTNLRAFLGGHAVIRRCRRRTSRFRGKEGWTCLASPTMRAIR